MLTNSYLPVHDKNIAFITYKEELVGSISNDINDMLFTTVLSVQIAKW